LTHPGFKFCSVEQFTS